MHFKTSLLALTAIVASARALEQVSPEAIQDSKTITSKYDMNPYYRHSGYDYGHSGHYYPGDYQHYHHYYRGHPYYKRSDTASKGSEAGEGDTDVGTAENEEGANKFLVSPYFYYRRFYPVYMPYMYGRRFWV
ncbi:hypothetical protein BGX21_000262 [Mortierella sp. AD011]|nr:hypothetical protein BGX20_000870 [Mortierella sp. AD010]KAF9401888.1 hypothetical protein BGX21_000262 [Mortierella sp. AD011]